MCLFIHALTFHFQGKVQEYLQDLYSGKLHREFHYGPDQEEEKVNIIKKNNFDLDFEDFFGCFLFFHFIIEVTLSKVCLRFFVN